MHTVTYHFTTASGRRETVTCDRWKAAADAPFVNLAVIPAPGL